MHERSTMKPSLIQLQNDFARALREHEHQALERIKVRLGKGPSAEARIGVYRDAYWARVTNSLAEDFPVLFDHLGDDFPRAVQDYIQTQRPGFPSLAQLSQGFGHLMAQQYPEIGEQIRLDYTILLSELDSWNLTLPERRAQFLSPDQLGQSNIDDVMLHWNSSLRVCGERLVFQFRGDTAIKDASRSLLQMLHTRENLSDLNQLLARFTKLDLDGQQISSLIRFLTENELLFFMLRKKP